MNPSLMQIINPEGALGSKVIIMVTVNPGALADRVLRNSEGNLKAPNGGNYCAVKMRSREYTVVLAIAMMDGSFNVDRQDKVVTHCRGGRERSGMHRDSARALLEYIRNNY